MPPAGPGPHSAVLPRGLTLLQVLHVPGGQGDADAVHLLHLGLDAGLLHTGLRNSGHLRQQSDGEAAVRGVEQATAPRRRRHDKCAGRVRRHRMAVLPPLRQARSGVRSIATAAASARRCGACHGCVHDPNGARISTTAA
jgi:hypothetical protein